MTPLLEVSRLTVCYGSRAALDRVNLRVEPAETVGIVGESGAGKSTLALAILGLLPSSAATSGAILFEGGDLLSAPEAVRDRVRGARIALLWQDPYAALNPVLRIEDQVAEVLRAHSRGTSRAVRTRRSREILEAVGLGDERRRRAFPHELSGGERQRAALAQAMVCRPSLLIADEPTSSLDAIMQAAVLDLLRDLVHLHGSALLFISHDPRVVKRLAQRVLVMERGRVVEQGPADGIFRRPVHTFTRELVRAAAELTAGTPSGDPP